MAKILITDAEPSIREMRVVAMTSRRVDEEQDPSPLDHSMTRSLDD